MSRNLTDSGHANDIDLRSAREPRSRLPEAAAKGPEDLNRLAAIDLAKSGGN
jgi:hypothetical protein